MKSFSRANMLPYLALIASLVVTFAIYLPGVGGGFIFDDYPNIVDNPGLQPQSLSITSLIKASLSSPASEFKRPLASLTFAANYLATGISPAPMKVTNIFIHLLNGIACFFLTRLLLGATAPSNADPSLRRHGYVAALVAASWMIVPINLTSVLYVVQRMESLANLLVFLALIAYIKARQRMRMDAWASFLLAATSITLLPLIGLLAKETAVLVPLYAVLIEVILFRWKTAASDGPPLPDRRVRWLFFAVLALPFVVGSCWMAVKLSNPRAWASRDFTLYTRLLSECRIVVDYIAWTIFPRADDLSFYHDNFVISTSFLSPATTALAAALLLGLVAAVVFLRRSQPLLSLGIGFFLACHVLTATVIPLELIYEHRNYFASYGLLIALIPMLAPPRMRAASTAQTSFLVWPRYVALGALMIHWTMQTAMTSKAWGTPLSLASELAARAPDSPRAQYELGRTYIILSKYDPGSPFTAKAYAPLERAMALPKSSILPEQALIFLNARMHIALRDEWWNSIVQKLEVRRPSVQDESSLGALGTCAVQGLCDLPADRMIEAFGVALSHPNPTPRLQAMYADYAWSALRDHTLGYRMITGASASDPDEPAYVVTSARFAIALGLKDDAQKYIHRLESMNVGRTLDPDIRKLNALLASASQP